MKYYKDDGTHNVHNDNTNAGMLMPKIDGNF